ncbi:hypothetical protein H0H92_015792 [Tricholoma furcatifolium]|nr:hypothetical protein H0H92_015792 [Tricholoma furcatifolium]
MPSGTFRPFVFVLIALPVIVSGLAGLSVKTTGPSTVENVENLQVVTTITNTGDVPLSLLNDPKSPLNPLPADTFRIIDNTGVAPVFTGIVAKYVHASAIAAGGDAITVLDPGRSVNVEHDLSEAYSFSKEGEYTVTPNTLFYFVDSAKQISAISATVEGTYTTKLSGRFEVPCPSHSDNGHPGPSFVGCSASQQASILNATEYAWTYAWEAFMYLRKPTITTSQRYVTWFGTYDSARHSIVEDHYQRISSPPSFPSFTYNCACTAPGTWGYVKPTEFGIIYLCPTFFTLPTHGKDSMVGSISWALPEY